MKKLLLLIGLVVFLTPMVVSAETVFKSELPKCYLKKFKTQPTPNSPKECFIKIIYSSGSTYEGELKKFEGSKRWKYHGNGIRIDEPNTINEIKYVGEYLKGKKQGYGIETKANGEIYKGEWKSNKYHGLGTLTLANGNKKEGMWNMGSLEGLDKVYCQKINGEVYLIKIASNNDCSPDKLIDEGQYTKILRKKELEEKTEVRAEELKLIKKCAYKNSYNDHVETLKGVSRSSRTVRNSSNWKTDIPGCELEDLKFVKTKTGYKKLTKYNELAMAVGCGIERKGVDQCMARHLSSVIGSAPLSLQDLNEIKKDDKLMEEIVFAIEEMNRQQNQSQNQDPTEEEKQQALAQENATGQATWKSTAGGIWYWDYGNGFGWAPPNPIRDKLIQGLMVSQRTKNMLKTGRQGRTIFIPR